MAGNRVVFQEAIRKAHNAAWDKKWIKAIDEYHRALREFPNDFSARLSLGHALEQAGQLEGAMHECRLAAKIQPEEPAALTRLANLQEKLGRADEAVASYLAVAEIHLKNRARGKAVEVWQKAAALAPDRKDVHEQLAEVYQKGAHNSLAAKEFLALAKIYQKHGDVTKASNAVNKALELDPRNPTVQAWIETERPVQSAEASAPTRVNSAEQAALSRLADTLLEDRTEPTKRSANQEASAPEIALTKPEIDALTARAIDAQTHHRVSDAITCYRKLVAGGVARPEVKFNLGLLYSETMQYEDAIRLLRETTMNPAYALASHYELGKCYRVLGNTDESLEHFLQVTKLVDLGSVQREQADELISVYQELADSYATKGDRQKAATFSRALQEFLSNKGWEDKVDQVRTRLEIVQGSDLGLEAIDSSDSSQVIEALALAQEYLKRGKIHAAGEECLRAIELAPDYLPAHLRLAEVLVKEGRIDEAKEKYQTLAELCMSRGDAERAESFYRQLLKVAPDDVISRSKLIDLSMQQGRVEDVLQQYLELGDDYARKGDFAKAAERFSEALRIAARDEKPLALTLALQHRYAEALARMGDFRRALTVYQEIKQRHPDDERALVYAIDLMLRLNQTDAAIKDLNELLDRYQSRGEVQKATSLLEGLAQSYPNEQSVLWLLAQSYFQSGNVTKAIEALDSLGELQLSVGQKQAAAATVRMIIAMNPPELDEYKLLLEQLGE